MSCWFRALILFAVVFGSISTNSSAQDFLKRLEEKLKQPTPQPVAPSPLTPSDAKQTEGEVLPSPSKEKPTNPFILNDGLLSGGQSSGGQSSGGQLSPPSAINKQKSAPPPPTNPQQPVEPSPFIPLPEAQVPNGDAGPPYLGLIAERVPGGGIGLLVVEVAQGSPAWKAGFQVNDRIMAIAGSAVSDLDQLAERLEGTQAGKPIKVQINRNGRNKELTAVPIDRSIAARTQPMLDGLNPVQGRAILGLSVANLSDTFRRQFGTAAFRGAAVTEVVRGSPAEQVGIQAGDCIVEIDGQVIQSAGELQDWLAKSKPGQLASIGFYRGRVFNQGNVILASDGPLNLDPNMITPDYVNGLLAELERVRMQLDDSQRRMSELEQRLRTLESGQRR